jgi:hypothetical protein
MTVASETKSIDQRSFGRVGETRTSPAALAMRLRRFLRSANDLLYGELALCRHLASSSRDDSRFNWSNF